MADQSFIQWPFFDDAHRELASEIDALASTELNWLESGHDEVDASCKKLVALLGAAGWLKNSVVSESSNLGLLFWLSRFCVCYARAWQWANFFVR